MGKTNILNNGQEVIIEPQYALTKEEFIKLIGEDKFYEATQTTTFNYIPSVEERKIIWTTIGSVFRCSCGASIAQAYVTEGYPTKKKDLDDLHAELSLIEQMKESTISKERVALLKQGIENKIEAFGKYPSYLYNVLKPHHPKCGNRNKIGSHTYSNRNLNRKKNKIASVNEVLDSFIIVRGINDSIIIQKYQTRIEGHAYTANVTFECMGEASFTDFKCDYIISGRKLKSGVKYKLEDSLSCLFTAPPSGLYGKEFVITDVLFNKTFRKSGVYEWVLKEYQVNYSYELSKMVEEANREGVVLTDDDILVRLFNKYPYAIVSYMKLYFTNLIKQPLIETYAKAGFTGYVHYYINNDKLDELKPFKQEFPFNKAILNEIVRLGWVDKYVYNAAQYKFIMNLAQLEQKGISISFEFFQVLIRNDKSVSLDTLESLILDYGYTLKELYGYLERCWLTQAITEADTITYLHDTCRMARDLELTVDRLPRSLKMVHDVLARDYQYSFDKKMNEIYEKRVSHLEERYNYEVRNYDYSIIAPKTLQCILDEGNQMKHCVASYARNVAAGKSTILFLRNKKEKQKSLVTIEIKDGMVVQMKGYKNANVIDKEILEFVAKWKNVKKVV